jgi:hypothetical protein
MLKTEGLVLQGIYVSHVRVGCEAKLPVVSIRPIWMEVSEAMAIVRPRSHKAF